MNTNEKWKIQEELETISEKCKKLIREEKYETEIELLIQMEIIRAWERIENARIKTVKELMEEMYFYKTTRN